MADGLEKTWQNLLPNDSIRISSTEPETQAQRGNPMDDEYKSTGSRSPQSDGAGNASINEELLAALTAQTKLMTQLAQRMETQAQPTMTHQVMPDLSQGISTYDGERYGSVAREWITKIRSSGALHRWTDAVKLETARMNLRGAARAWYDARELELQTWPAFEAAFEKTFDKKLSTTELWEKMRARVQNHKEGLSSYFHDKNRMCKDVGLNFIEAKEQIITGLARMEVKSALLTKMHADADELLHDILALERIHDQGATKKMAAVIKPNVTETVQLTRNEPHTRHRKAPRWNENGQPKCFNCNLYGHISRECEKPKRSTKSETTARVQTVEDTKVNKYLKDVVINGRETVTGIIDGGSSICTVKDSTASQLRLVRTFGKKELYAFGNTQTPAVICDAKIDATIEVDGVSAKVELWVVANNAQTADVIVGRTYTELPHVAYLKVGENLIFGRQDDELFKKVLPVRRVNLKVIENGELKQDTVNLIRAVAGEDEYKVPVMGQWQPNAVVPKDQVIGYVRPRKQDGRQTEKANTESRRAITRDDLNVSSSTSEPDVQKLLELVNEYRDCFALAVREIGCTNLLKMEIVDNGTPVRCAPIRASVKEREVTKQIVREWKELGIVRETTSPYASPVLLVAKKTGEPRLVVDYRKLNKQTVKDNFPIPNVDEVFETLSECRIFTTLDLMSGYLQVPLSEEAKPKTAFITCDETGEFERMVFGLCNAPFVFSRLIQMVLGPIKDSNVVWFMDDILVPGRDWQEMCKQLEKVLNALRNAKLTLNLKKCSFGQSEIDFLGFTISNATVKPGKQKSNAVRDYPKPRNVHETRRFLGLTSYFRRFVNRYAERARPLTDLTKKNIEFIWGNAEQRSFEDLKNALVQEPVLRMYDPRARTQLHCDASADGLAGVLMQKKEQGGWQAVHYLSKKTTDAERKYHSSKLELMAIVFCVNRLRQYLIGIPFEIVTDCQALTYLNAQRTVNPQIARWYYLLSEYDCQIKHRAGIKMAHVDALSRAACEEPSDTETDIYSRCDMLQQMTEEDYVLLLQRGDERLKRLVKILEKDATQRNDEELNAVNNYELNNGRLVRKVNVANEQRRLYVLPNSMRKSMMIKFHDQLGHFALDRTVMKVLERYWFAGLRRYARQHIRACVVCALNKVPGGKQQGQLHPIPFPKRPFERVHLDHLGPFVTTSRKNTYLLLATDGFSKYVRMWAVKSTKVKAVLNAMREFVNEYGLPERVVTDRGSCFTSKEFEEYCDHNGIKHTLNSTRHPRANGQVERANRTVLPVIRATVAECSDNMWDTKVTEIQRNLNCQINKTTGKTPFELVYGYVPRHVDGEYRILVQDEENAKDFEDRDLVRVNVRERAIREQRKQSAYFNRRHARGVTYDVGEMVFMKRAPEHTGESTKLQAKYRGPLVITHVMPSDTYRVTDICTTGKRFFATTAHVSQLKPYSNHEDDEESDAEEEIATEETEETPDVSSNGLGEALTNDNGPESDESAELEIPARSAATRQRRQPPKYDDYVMFTIADAKVTTEDGCMSGMPNC